MIKSNYRTDYFFPKRLTQQLSQIQNYPLTVVEAPSGFGKTTAVSEYLKQSIPEKTEVYWYTCLGEPLHTAWNRICEIISPIDNIVIQEINNQGVPNKDSIFDLLGLIRQINCREQTILVVDNYQFIQNDNLDTFFNALSLYISTNFHIVLITQPIAKRTVLVNNIKKLVIDRSYFFFSKGDIDIYFRQSGLRLSAEELDKIWQCTEGWIAAICLQKINYAEKEMFINTSSGIDGLLKSSILNRLGQKEQEFLTSLSIFNSFTLSQAMVMLDTDVLPEYAYSLLEENDFIRFDNTSQSYFIHSLLREYLLKRLEQLKTTQFGKTAYYLAGNAFKLVGQNYRAALCFYEISDFDRLLSLPLMSNELDEWVGLGSESLIANIINNCPKDTLCRYPKTLLVFALELVTLGKYELFGEVCNLIQNSFETNTMLSSEEMAWLSGEFSLVMSFTKFNNIELMSEEHMRAYDMIKGSSKLFAFGDCWSMDSPSVLYLFWSESGALHKEIESLDMCMPLYYKLVNGHGMGAEFVMRAEAMLLAGDDMGAEELCHKALYLAEQKEQGSICFCAELCLLRISVLRGDADLFKTTMEHIQKRSLAGSNYRSQYTKALIRGTLSLQINNEDDLASWLLDPKEIERVLYDAAIPYGQMIYVGSLIAKKEYSKVIGISDILIERAENQGFLLTKIYLLIYLSIAYLSTSQKNKAVEQLEKALQLALPDKVYLPFAENAHLLADMLGLYKSKAGLQSSAIDIILKLADRLRKGKNILNEDMKDRELLFTQREKEIAILAREGKTNKEIGALLYISPETVKMTLKKVFQKSNIRSRAQLETIHIK